jgi:hypothetical protein
MRESTRTKLRRLKKAPAIIGCLLILKPIVQFLFNASNIDFYISASGNPRMVAIWNFFATPSGNIILIVCGFLLLAYLVVKPEAEEDKQYGTPEHNLTPKEKRPEATTAKVGEQEEQAAREIIKVSPDELAAFFEGHTEIQGKTLTQPYIGKWMRFSGIVKEVSSYGQSVEVSISPLTASKGGGVYAEFREQKQIDMLRVLKRESKITVLGQISYINSKIVGLTDCELVETNPLEQQPPAKQEQSEAANSAPTKLDPVLVCGRIYITPVYWTGYKFTVQEKPDEDPIYSLVAGFVNRPKAKGYVPPISFLQAQLTYYDDKGRYYGRVAHSHWLGHDFFCCDLDAGGEAALIVAVSRRGGYMFAVSNPRSGATAYEEKPPLELKGDVFRVQAHLWASGGEELTVNFEIGAKPGELPTIKTVET